MPRAPSAKDEIASLTKLRADPRAATAGDQLDAALSRRSAAVVAAAARIVGEAELTEQTAAMTEAFARFMQDPTKRDKGCLAKTALADALYKIEADVPDVFLTGIRHVQLEPVWGGKEDTAMELRGVCALGLVRINHHDVVIELAELLADPHVMARCSAARAIAYGRFRDQGLPLLRLKVRAGDDDPRVLEACMEALMTLDAEHSLPFVTSYLEDEDVARRETAALALGGSRRPEAVAPLRALLERSVTEEERRLAMLALAMLRQESALTLLLGILEDGSEHRAREVIETLATYRHDGELLRRVTETADERGDPQLSAFARERFEA